MTQFEKIKQEISAMSLDEFFKHFISGKGIREYRPNCKNALLK